MFKKFLTLLLLSCGLVFNAQAAELAEPVNVLKNVVASVMQEISGHKKELQKNPKVLQQLVEHIIVPHIDFVEMSRWIAGRNAWNAASAEAQQRFVMAFKDLVVRTYASALLNYQDQKIEFLPLREPLDKKTRVKVSSLIKENGKEPVRLDYYLVNHNGQWQVYDFIIEGVSLVKGYDAQFGDDIRQRGLEPVIIKLNAAAVKNRS